MPSVHIWCPRASDSAIKIRDSLRLKGLKAYKTPIRPTKKELRWFLERINIKDLWINWGSAPNNTLAENAYNKFVSSKGRVLNKNTIYNKKTQLLKLAASGVSVPVVYDTEQPGTVGRSLNHYGGSDLLRGTGRDYWTQKLNLNHEIRVHVFDGKSIHTGKKILREGWSTHPNNVAVGFQQAHPWIRTYSAGWRIEYAYAPQIRQDRRDIAIAAVKALGLDFGAVDVGILKGGGGKPVVLEVNTAPGLDEGPSVEVYVNQIIAKIGG